MLRAATLASCLLATVEAWLPVAGSPRAAASPLMVRPIAGPRGGRAPATSLLAATPREDAKTSAFAEAATRREALKRTAATLAAFTVGGIWLPAQAALAEPAVEDAAAAAAAAASIRAKAKAALVEFVDPVGLFSIGLPKGYYKVRPTAEGDLPNSDGIGRRGSRIFSAGEVSNQYAPKIVSVERFPARKILMDDKGVVFKDAGSIETWESMGKVDQVAEILVNQRDKEAEQAGKSMNTNLVKGSAKVSGSTLEFACVTDVPIMRPELLEEQTGRREIKRINFFRGELRAKETMNTKAGEEPRAIVTAVWVSVEQSDYAENTAFAAQIDAILDSFKVN